MFFSLTKSAAINVAALPVSENVLNVNDPILCETLSASLFTYGSWSSMSSVGPMIALRGCAFPLTQPLVYPVKQRSILWPSVLEFHNDYKSFYSS